LGSASPEKVVYGHWLLNGLPGEDLIVCPKQQNCLEIHCHGGKSATSLISQSLVAAGAVAVNELEILSRMTGSEYRAEMISAASRALTRHTARYLLAQPRNHLEFWSGLQNQLNAQEWRSATGLVDQSQAWHEFGRHLTEPWSVVFCGPPNVGKSSLINRLLGFQRAIVHHEAGTTRDTVSETTAIQGWPVRLCDTAGMRETTDQIERKGIQETRKTIAGADLLILVVDANEADIPTMRSMVDQFDPALIVANKSDLRRITYDGVDLHVSALTGMGLDDLSSAIAHQLVPEIPHFSEMIPITAKQLATLNRVRQLIGEGQREHAESLTAAICQSLS
jgi:tRNA modification GTPase